MMMLHLNSNRIKLILSLVFLFGCLALIFYFSDRARMIVEAQFREEDDPDVPRFLRGRIDKEQYLLLRAGHIARLRGLPFERPGQRAQALREMERQMANIPQAPNAPQGLNFWTSIGPAPIPNGQTEGVVTPVSGRTTAIAVHPTNPNIIYVGTAQGGVYRSLDGGATWTAIFDGAQSLAIGSIAIAPSNPGTIYVGTGEPNLSCDSFFGVGVYRITNADGASPTLSGPFNSDGANDVMSGRSIGRIIVHPTNPDIVFVATATGIGGIGCTQPSTLPGMGLFRSINATGACTFTKLTTATATSGGFVGNFSHIDVAMDPNDPNRVICSVNGQGSPTTGTGGGIYLSTNALAAAPTFTRTLTLSSFRSELTLHSSGGVVTVFAATAESSGTLRKSTDGGATWPTTLASANGFCDGQCWYNIALAVDPANVNTVLIGGNVTGASTKLIARSINGGTTFTNVAGGVHADAHAVTFAPSNTNIAYLGTDGGIYKTINNGASWSSINGAGFSATQFQSIATHPTDREYMLGGTQDNGTNFKRADGLWTRADGGDGGYVLIDQNTTSVSNVTIYHTYFNSISFGVIGFSRALNASNPNDSSWTFLGCGGTPNGINCSDSAVLFYAPMALGPGNPNTFYFGTDRLYRSVNNGSTMAVVSQQFAAGIAVSAIGIARQNDNVRIVGLSNGRIFRTMTGSSPMTEVTDTNMPIKFASRAAIDPNNQETAYVTYSGYGVPLGRHIWKTTNLSAAAPAWVPSSNGIPDVPVNAFVVDPLNSNNLYAGTDIGVYRSTDGGATWLPFSASLARVAVFDLAFQGGNNGAFTNRVLRAATHGRGIWEMEIPIGGGGACHSVAGVSPASGPVGANVTITGDNFTGVTAVKFDNNISTQFILNSNTQLTVTIPAGAVDGPITISKTGCTDVTTTAFDVTVCPIITISPPVLPSGTVGVSYGQTLTGSGGTAPYIFSVGSGGLPPGLTLSTGGAISGTPSQAGTFMFTATATDAGGCIGALSYSLTVNGVGPTNGLQYYPLLAPIRLLETRPGGVGCFAPGAPLSAGGVRNQQARITCNGVTIPATAQAIIGNATVVNVLPGSQGGYITLYPGGVPQPTVSNLNYVSGQIIPNSFTVGLGSDGTFNIFALTSTHFIVDVTGYFAP